MRLGLVGLDSSHADQVVDLVARGRLGPDVRMALLGVPASRWSGEVSAARVTHLAEKHAHAPGPPAQVAAGPPDEIARVAAGQVDAVVVADRDGRAHAQHAAPFLRAGVPVFVDKPFTLDVAEALDLVALAERSGALLTSFSPLRWQPSVRELARAVERVGGPVAVTSRGPVVGGSPHGGLAFYAVHAIEAALAVARGPLVEVRRLSVEEAGRVRLELVTERDVASVVLEHPVEGVQVPFSLVVEAGGERWVSEIALGEEYLLPGLEVFCAAVRSGGWTAGEWPVSPRALVDVVRALEALR